VAEKPAVEPAVIKGNKEVYSSNGSVFQAQAPVIKPAAVKPASKPPVSTAEDFDPENAVIATGTACKRNGCGYEFKAVDISRGDGSESQCQYHPGTPIFHEVRSGVRRRSLLTGLF
jgi:hypothetical protein